MRIGILLRSLDEKFGIGVYTRNILGALLSLEPNGHDYVLFYRSKEHLGKYTHYPHVEEHVVSAPNKLIWDQVAIPLMAKRTNVDVLFHTKFTVPFLTRSKTVMMLHGATWFARPEVYPDKLDLAYIKMMMPRYCQRANAILSNSELTRQDFIHLVGVPAKKITTVYFGVNPIFRRVTDRKQLARVKERYHLPERFILTVGQYDPVKNFQTTFDSFSRCRDAGELKLVAVGKDSWKYKSECGISGSRFEDDVIFTGYVEQEDLPSFYSLAEAFIYPSIYETFGIPLIEAMASGCPVVSSNTGAIPEITNGAAFLADPFNSDRMAHGIDKFIYDSTYRQEKVAKGFKRASIFRWELAAQETLQILEDVMA